MDLTEIQEKQREFILSRKWERFDASLIFAHLIEELGEIASHFLYKAGYKVAGAGHKENNDDLSTEFAQAFNLFLQLAIQAEVDLEKAWIAEHEKNHKRFSKEEWEKIADNAQKSKNQV